MRLLYFILIFLFSRSHAQSITGYVTIQNSGSKSAFPAQVISDGASATDVSSNNGEFRLTYDKKVIGEDVIIEIKKPGYEIVNKEALFARIPQNASKAIPVRIYMCPIGEWQKSADKYYGINQQNIIRTYEKKLEEVRRKYKNLSLSTLAYKNTLSDLNKEKEAALSQAKYWAEKLATTNLDDASERVRKGLYYFEKQNLDSALFFLQRNEIINDINNAKKEIRDADTLKSIYEQKIINATKALQQAIEALLTNARIQVQNFSWDEAEAAYDLVVQNDSSNLKNIWEAANFYALQGKTNKTLSTLNSILKKDINDTIRVIVLSRLADIFFVSNRHTEAEEHYLKSLNIYNRIELDTSSSLSYAITLGQYGSFLLQTKRLEQAQQVLKKADSIYNKISLFNKTIIVLAQADLYSVYGGIYSEMKQFNFADSCYNYAEEVIRNCGCISSPKSKCELAILLMNSSNVKVKTKQFSEAEFKLLEANKIFKDLSRHEQGIHFKNLADSYFALANLYIAMDSVQKAYFSNIEGMRIYHQLLSSDPKMYEPHLANAYYSQGVISYQLDNHKDAQKYFLDAAEIFKSLTLVNKNVYEPEFAKTLLALGLENLNSGIVSVAQNYLYEALCYFEDLSKKHPEIYLKQLGDAYIYLGFAKKKLNLRGAAKKFFIKSKDVHEQLAKKCLHCKERLQEIMKEINELEK